jgi:acylphosphatase
LERARSDRAPENDMERQRLKILYSGHVQGVGFRYTVKNLTAGYDVVGTIRNLADGRVELVAEGLRAELTAFQKAIRDSGLDRMISEEQATWSAAKDEFRGFTIVG